MNTNCYNTAWEGISFDIVLLLFYRVYFFYYYFLSVLVSFSFFYLVIEDYIIDVCDYVIWDDIIGLKGSKRF